MDTVLNIGLTDATVEGLAELTGNPRFAWDAYRRLVEGFGKVVLDIPDTAFEHALHGMKAKAGAKLDTDLTTENLKALTAEYKAIVQEAQGLRVPPEPYRAAPPGDRGRLQELERQARASTTATTRASPTTWAPRSTS